MGRSQRLSVRGLNWSRPIGVYWITLSGVTKSLNTPERVRWHTSSQPTHQLFTCICYADALQALVWCHTATYRSDLLTTHVKEERNRWLSCRKCICAYNLYIKCPLVWLNNLKNPFSVCLKWHVNWSYCFRWPWLWWQPRHAQLLQAGLHPSRGGFEKSWCLGSLHAELRWGEHSFPTAYEILISDFVLH